MSSETIRDFFLGFVKIHILFHCGVRPYYGQELKDELSEHGYSLSYGTLYPMLHELHSKGFLSRENRIQGGRILKYYSLTETGQGLLMEAKGKIGELVDEVLGDGGKE